MRKHFTIDLGTANPKQARFYRSRARYTAYGGARGGGKSHAVRTLALLTALREESARILIVRRTYPELEQGMIEPMLAMLPRALCSYNGTKRCVSFVNGSVIRFGHLGADEGEYQGQEYDRIFIDEATQFTERQFRVLGACLRGTSGLEKRMYLTCNPGGVGHAWVKRLFISRDFLPGENPADYVFIPATVEDNRVLLEGSPGYLEMLDLLPDDIRRAHRFGDWDALSGAYFSELRENIHRCEPYRPRPEDTIVRALDYGLDMLACLWVAVKPDGSAVVYREIKRPGLIVSAACREICGLTPASEHVSLTLAPPDLRSRQKDTGKSIEWLFAECGVPLTFTANARVDGWMALRELLRGSEPRLKISRECAALWRDLTAIQHDADNPNDCAGEPHDVTHICDALRYFAVSRIVPPEGERTRGAYERFMLGM